MTAFLTRTDLHHLTGHSRRAGMQEWLTREGR